MVHEHKKKRLPQVLISIAPAHMGYPALRAGTGRFKNSFTTGKLPTHPVLYVVCMENEIT